MSPATYAAAALLALSAIVLADPPTPTTLPAGPPAPAESFDAGSLHVDHYGRAGTPIVLLPGLGCGSWEWYHAISRLSQTHQIYAVGLPGFDARPMTDKRPLFAAFTADFWTLLQQHNIDKPLVIGHSLGGTLAFALAEDHPERLRGIIAVDGLPIFPSLAAATPSQRAALAANLAGAFSRMDKPAELASEKQYMATTGTTHAELVDSAAALITRSDPAALGAWVQEDLTTDLRPALAAISIPVLEIVPYNAPDAAPPRAFTKDQTVAFYKSILSPIPHLQVLPVENSRHFIMFDQPQALDQLLQSAIDAPPSTAP